MPYNFMFENKTNPQFCITQTFRKVGVLCLSKGSKSLQYSPTLSYERHILEPQPQFSWVLVGPGGSQPSLVSFVAFSCPPHPLPCYCGGEEWPSKSLKSVTMLAFMVKVILKG